MKGHLTVLFIIIITLLLPSLSANGQHFVVSYQYDDSGNRVCQSPMQVAPYNPKTGLGDSMAQCISHQSDTMNHATMPHLYSQETMTAYTDEKERKRIKPVLRTGEKDKQ